MLSPYPPNDRCLAPSALAGVHLPTTVVKSWINRPSWETDSAKPIIDYKYDYERSRSPLEEQ